MRQGSREETKKRMTYSCGAYRFFLWICSRGSPTVIIIDGASFVHDFNMPPRSPFTRRALFGIRSD
jgi:hypothetical protein